MTQNITIFSVVSSNSWAQCIHIAEIYCKHREDHAVFQGVGGQGRRYLKSY